MADPTIICIDYVGEPIPQPRQRFRRGKGGRPIPYIDKDDPVVPYKQKLADLYRDGGYRMAAGPLSVVIDFRLGRDGRIHPRIPATAVPAFFGSHRPPDLDNLAKSVLDALNKVAWNDDQQIVILTLRKLYPPAGVSSGVSVFITSVPESDWPSFAEKSKD
jgi:Holliday junction resolvase RusA-like endonuclease